MSETIEVAGLQTPSVEVEFKIGTTPEMAAEFSVRLMDEILLYLETEAQQGEKPTVLGGFWVDTPGGEMDHINLSFAKTTYIGNLTNTARLCGVRLVGPVEAERIGRITDAKLAIKIIPILKEKLSPKLLGMLEATLPKIGELLKSTLRNREILENEVSNRPGAHKIDIKRVLASVFSPLQPIFERKPKPQKIDDDEELPKVAVEVVFEKSRGTLSSGKKQRLYLIKTFPLKQLEEKMTEEWN